MSDEIKTMNEILPQRKEIRLQGYDYSCQGNYFVTIVVQNRQCLFGSVVDGKMQQNAAGDVIEQVLILFSNNPPWGDKLRPTGIAKKK